MTVSFLVLQFFLPTKPLAADDQGLPSRGMLLLLLLLHSPRTFDAAANVAIYSS